MPSVTKLLLADSESSSTVQVVRNGFVIWDDLDQQVSCSVEHVRDPVIDDVLRGFLACDVNQPLEALGLSVPYGTASSAFADWALACNRWPSDHCVEMCPFDKLEHEFIIREIRLGVIA